jgi:hypothetical protein
VTSELEFQNAVVLAVVQALIGAVRSEVVAVTVATSKERETLDLYWLVTDISEQLREIVDEVEADLDALLSGSVRIVSDLSVGSDWTDSSWNGRRHRVVFARSTDV